MAYKTTNKKYAAREQPIGHGSQSANAGQSIRTIYLSGQSLDQFNRSGQSIDQLRSIGPIRSIDQLKPIDQVN